MQKDCRLSGGSGGPHDEVAAQIQLANTLIAGEEVVPEVLEGHIRIGDPVVEARHEGLLVEDRQFANLLHLCRHVTVAMSIERLRGPCMSHEVAQADPLYAGQPLRVGMG